MHGGDPGPGRESVWDYPRPPALEPTGRHVRVRFGGLEIADSTACLRVLETSHPPAYYIPPADVRINLLRMEPGRRSFCEWKGTASYWTIRVGDAVSVCAGWSYPEPTSRFGPLKDYISFYAGKVDEAWVDGTRVVPQAGDYYGGWITPDVAGPFKGDSGTEHW